MKASVSINPQKVSLVWGSVAAFLLMANLAGVISTYVFGHNYVYGVVPLFDVDREANVPTLFSSLELFMCAGLFFLISAAWKQSGNTVYRYWQGLGWIFMFLMIDEALQIHEPLIDPLQRWLHTSGLWYYAWVIPYGIGVGVFALVYLRFFFQLPLQTKTWLSLAAILYVGGALGLEMIGGWYQQSHGKNLVYALLTTVEEGLEMYGAIILIFALMRYLAEAPHPVAFLFSTPSKHPPGNL